ncbi:DEAD/DEAH box helicase [Candidatus Nanohalococcus occultus]|uniref:DEAD/DEAH box helicase n=1 Tax=Candidatus Nanohalococcus occultus TaxID=2978047 RepID=UPI0039E0FD7B
MKVQNLDIPEGIREGFLDSGITDLNPPQQDAVKSGLLDAEDMIIASPTASGKTLIAEIGISKQVVENNKTAIYIVPLKALASEKYQDFSERFEDQDVRIAVGDHDDSGESLSTADIVVATSEKLDSLLRHNPSWIHEIGLVVIDEIHLITSPDRGPTLEVTIARLRDILDFQLLGLSATISNSDELADWLDAELVESKYRPVELKHGVYWDNEIEFYSEETIEENSIPNKNPEPGGKLEGTKVGGFSTGNEVKEQEKEEIESEKVFIEDKHGRGSINLIQNTLNIDKQAIVFCSSRKGSEKSSDRAGKITTEDLSRDERKKLKDYADRIENVLGSPTSQCKRLAENVRKGAAFHHAGLVNKQRELVEDAFREGLVRTVSATPTLAAGVNLPAYRVIMRDLKRYTGDGMDFIPTLEYEQMSGRAGRPKYDDQGEAISIAKQPGMPDEIRERYIFGQSEHIQSKLAAEPVLRMHTLSLVASGFCTSMEGLLEFYSETLYAFQYGELSEVEQQVKRVVEQLRDFKFLEETGMEATKTGRRVSELYIDPESAYNMIQCMKRAEKRENTEALSYLFMACRTTEIRNLRVKNKEYQDIAQTLLDAKKYLLESAPNEWDPEYDSFLESLKTSLMLKAWINEKDEESIMDKYDTAPGGVRAKTRNADWLLYSAQELARMKEIDVQNDLKKLRVRLKHGIGEDLLSLVKYDQIGRVRARKLYDHGIRDREDIREVSFEKLKKLIGKRTAKKLKKQVGEENIFDRENIMDYF